MADKTDGQSGRPIFFSFLFLPSRYFTITDQKIFQGLEYVSPSRRSISGPLTMGLGNALAGMSEPWLLKYLVDWKIFHQILFSVPLISLVTPL